MKSHVWWIVGGIVSLLGGIFAILNPFPASLAVNFLAGWTFVMIGMMSVIGAFQFDMTGPRVMMILFGLAGAALGVSLVLNPLAGLVTLTALVGGLIFVSAVAKIVAAFRMGGSEWFWLMLLSGVISLLLAVLIFADFPASALSILGLFLGIELIFNGISMFSMASMARRASALLR